MLSHNTIAMTAMCKTDLAELLMQRSIIIMCVCSVVRGRIQRTLITLPFFITTSGVIYHFYHLQGRVDKEVEGQGSSSQCWKPVMTWDCYMMPLRSLKFGPV